MNRLIAWACAAACIGAVAPETATAALLVAPAKSVVAQVNALSDDMLNVSFWGQPYPHGYSGWRRCPRGIRVETPYGWRCSTAAYRERGPVLRSRN